MEQAEQLIKRFKQAKTISPVVTRLIQLINDDNSTLQDFEEVIRADPLLVSRLLTLVNSSYFSLVRKVDSISRAVALLGMKNLHNIAVTDAIQGMLSENGDNGEFSPGTLWVHSSATGICCKMIAERIFTLNGDDAYLCGILHDIGLIAEWRTDRDRFLAVYAQLGPGGPAITELEQAEFGTDHCEVGYLLAREWQIPEPVAEAIRDHHIVNTDLAPQSPTGILQISEYIVHQIGFGLRDHATNQLSPALSAHIQENVEEYKVLAADLPDEVDKVRQLYGS